jgi:translocation protein SEC72
MQVAKLKEEGNAQFKQKKWGASVGLYSMALKVAGERMPWEMAAVRRDELAVVLCNRAAAFASMGDVSAFSSRDC